MAQFTLGDDILAKRMEKLSMYWHRKISKTYQQVKKE